MRKMGFCVTCNKSFPVEVRLGGKLVGLGAGALGLTRKLPWWGQALLFVASIGAGHVIDEVMMKVCPTPGCKTILRIVEAAL